MKLTLTLLILIKKIKSKKIEGKSSGKWGKTQKKNFFQQKIIRFLSDISSDSDKIPHQILTRFHIRFWQESDLFSDKSLIKNANRSFWYQTCLVRFLSDSDVKSDKFLINVWRKTGKKVVNPVRNCIRIWQDLDQIRVWRMSDA